MTDSEREVREFCETLGGGVEDLNPCLAQTCNHGDCKLANALMAVLDEDRHGECGDNPAAIKRHVQRQIGAAYAALFGSKE